jgi:hypothetical protein
MMEIKRIFPFANREKHRNPSGGPMRLFVLLPVLLAVLTCAAPVRAQTCSGLINYVESGAIYGIRMKGIDKGHTLTITKIDKENCVFAATTGKGDIILIDANSVSVLTRQ